MVTARAMGTPILSSVFFSNQHCWVKDTLKLQSVGIFKVENNWFGEKCFVVKVISLASITCNLETEMLILTMYWHFKKYLKMLNTLGKYLNTIINIFNS